MELERIKPCPCCIKKGKTNVDIYAQRQSNGDLVGFYIFGDDDFDLPSSMLDVKNVKFSSDMKNVVQIECPACREFVDICAPIIKENVANLSQQSKVVSELQM